MGSAPHLPLTESYVAASGGLSRGHPLALAVSEADKACFCLPGRLKEQVWEALTHNIGNSQTQEECLEVLATKKNEKCLSHFSQCGT